MAPRYTRIDLPSLVTGVRNGLTLELKKFAREEHINLDLCTITLYTQLSVGAEGSQSTLILHACPDVEGKPWYDDVLITTSMTPRAYAAGKLRVFVSMYIPATARKQTSSGGDLGQPNNEDRNLIMALCHLYFAPPVNVPQSVKRRQVLRLDV